jgi:hypothetical protein
VEKYEDLPEIENKTAQDNKTPNPNRYTHSNACIKQVLDIFKKLKEGTEWFVSFIF